VYRIDDLARAADTTVRNVRAYQDRGLLPPPRREGRVAIYDDGHLARLRLIGNLLERGFTLANIGELTAAWDKGKSLGAVLGLVPEITGPWSDETPEHVPAHKLLAMFSGGLSTADLAFAVELGLLEPEGNGFRITSPRELAIGVELNAAGVPMQEVFAELRQLRADMEGIASRFIDLTARHIWERYAEKRPDEEPDGDLHGIVQRLRPMAQAAVDAELARAMRLHATQYLENVIQRMIREEPSSKKQV
jgi:DNA-binding transcriptional MerR regulator